VAAVSEEIWNPMKHGPSEFYCLFISIYIAVWSSVPLGNEKAELRWIEEGTGSGGVEDPK
jgi:hypothetical protein